jgi:hypothetical protein
MPETTPPSTFLDRKLARRFRTYDLDGDGVIERRDFRNAAEAMAEEFDQKPGSAARERLALLCLGLWDHLASVADQPRRVPGTRLASFEVTPAPDRPTGRKAPYAAGPWRRSRGGSPRSGPRRRRKGFPSSGGYP